MALFEQFPYTNFHEMNLDWALRVAESAQEHLDGYDEDMATIAQNATDTESWKNAAAGSASAAAGSALAASGSANAAALSAADKTNVYEAEAWAKGTKNGVAVSAADPQYHDNAKYWANDKTNVYEAEAWAKGTKNGVPVASDAEQYEDNSKYWAQRALAISDAIMPFTLGSACTFSVENLTVKAARTVTRRNGGTDSINLPGLVVFAAPYPQLPLGEQRNLDYKHVVENGFFVSALWSLDQTAPPTVFLPYEYPSGACMVDDGKAYDFTFMRAFDLSTGTWAVDDVTYTYLIGIATNGTITSATTAENAGSIGEEY